MNKLILILLAFIGTLSACTSAEQKLVDDLDGSWQINQIVFDRYDPLPDTTVIPTSLSLIDFFACTVADGYCDGSYAINGVTDEDFTFNAIETDGEKQINIDPSNVDATYLFNGLFIITTLTPTNLAMEAEGYNNFTGFNILFKKVTISCTLAP
jgi:hypothetical protein